jgi:DNA-binding transcriptional LysR family regulator
MGNLRSNSGAVLIVAAFAGHGLVRLPTYFVGEALQSGRLVAVLDDYMAPPYTLRALYPHNRQGTRFRRLSRGALRARAALGQLVPRPPEQSALPASHRREIGSSTKPRRSKTRADAP